jgi:hypothetical protein
MTKRQLAPQVEKAIIAVWPNLPDDQRELWFNVLDTLLPRNTPLLETLEDLGTAQTEGSKPTPQEEATVDAQRQRNQGAMALLESWLTEDAAMTPEEAAAVDADWADFQQAMNTNRAPEPPLFT